MTSEPTIISFRKAILAILSLLIFTGIMMVVLDRIGTERLRNLIAQAGAWAPVLYVVLKASTYIVAPLSGGPLQVSSGALFGLWRGTAYSLLGDILGGCANFWISRSFGRAVVTKFVGKKGLARIDTFSHQIGGWRALLFARLFLSSFYDFISYAAGLTTLNFSRYLLVTALGGFFPTLVFVGIGASLAEDRRMLLLIYGGLVVLFILPVVLQRRYGRAIR